MQKIKSKYDKIIKLIVIIVILNTMLLSTLFFKEFFVNFMNFNLKTTNYENNLYVNFVDVGQGKSIAVRFEDGKSLIVDCGPKTESRKFFNFLSDQFMTSNCNSYIDYLVITHGDSDHIGNAEKLLENYEIKTIYLPIYFEEYITNETTNEFSNLISIIKQKNCNICYSFSNKYIIGENYVVKFLSPMNSYYSNENDYSTVLKLEYKGKSFLFTGDITNGVEENLLKNYNSFELFSTVLDISHHGSNSASSNEFLFAVKPEYAVISYGTNNYDLPNENMLSRLMDYTDENKILTTFDKGSIVFNVNDEGELSYTTIQNTYSLKTNYSWFEIFCTCEILICLFAYLYQKNLK